MSLLTLPNELLLQVAQVLDTKALCSLLLTSRYLTILLTPTLLKYAYTTRRHCVTALYLAAASQDEEKIKLLLSKSEIELRIDDVFILTGIPNNPPSPIAIQYLLAKQADSVIQDNASGSTALHWAARCGHEVMFKRLLEKGASIEIQNWGGAIVLHWAVLGKNEAIVRLLLERGSEVNAVDTFDDTPLHIAADEGLEAIAQLLIEYGARVNAKDSGDETPLIRAVARNHEGVAKLLLKKRAGRAGIGILNSFRNSALHIAAGLGNKAMVRLLLENGAFPDSRNLDLRMPIHIARDDGNVEIVKMLEDFRVVKSAY